MSVYTEFWKLKSVIVGNVINFNLEKLDKTFQLWYWNNLTDIKKNRLFDTPWSALWYFDNVDYKVDQEKIYERKEDMDNFSKILSNNFWVKVYRPDELDKIQTFKTPDFFWVLTPVTNPRDRVFVYWKNIIETPAMIRKRYFENQLLYRLFQEFLFEKWYNWISAPLPRLTYDRFDDLPRNSKKDYDTYNKKDYDISFDAAQILKIWKDLLFNVTSYNHENWAYWLQRVLDSLWTWAKVHKVYSLDDNHIDWVLMVLKPGVFLVNNDYVKKPHLHNIKKMLPEKFHNWKFIYIEDNPDFKIKEDILDSRYTNYLKLCSIRGSYTNVLPIDEKTVCVNMDAVKTINVLEKNWFNVIPIRFRHCEIFWWWLHCATLDLEREDELTFY